MCLTLCPLENETLTHRKKREVKEVKKIPGKPEVRCPEKLAPDFESKMPDLEKAST